MPRNRYGLVLRNTAAVIEGGNTTAGKCIAISCVYRERKASAWSMVMMPLSIGSKSSSGSRTSLGGRKGGTSDADWDSENFLFCPASAPGGDVNVEPSAGAP